MSVISGGEESQDGVRRASFVASDGAELSYLETGAGKPLVMLPAWSMTAAAFRFQLLGLADRYRVIALDQRGHGASANVAHGYRIARLGKDLAEFMAALRLEDVALLGHSLGNSVMWSYWEMFGRAGLRKLIIVDEAAFLVRNPSWTPKKLRTQAVNGHLTQ